MLFNCNCIKTAYMLKLSEPPIYNLYEPVNSVAHLEREKVDENWFFQGHSTTNCASSEED